MSIRLGIDAKLYYKVGGQNAGGAWVELTNVQDVETPLEKSEADVTTRGNNGWEALAGVLKRGSVEWKMVWDTADAGFTAIKNSFFNNAIIGLQILDSAGGQGLQGDFEIFAFNRSEPLQEALTVSVTAKIGYSATPPTWIGG